jgi:hypothetical protein
MRKRVPRREQIEADDEARGLRMQTIALGLFIGMNCAAAVGVYWGWKAGLSGWPLVSAGLVLFAGAIMVLIGLLELEWLERVFYLVDFIFLDPWMWLGSTWFGWGNLADNEWIGRRGAQTIFVCGGIIVYAFGWLRVLGVF